MTNVPVTDRHDQMVYNRCGLSGLGHRLFVQPGNATSEATPVLDSNARLVGWAG